MTARLTERGFVVLPEAMFILRQGLFITTHYLDPVVRDDSNAWTGLDHEDFAGLMQQIDDVGW